MFTQLDATVLDLPDRWLYIADQRDQPFRDSFAAVDCASYRDEQLQELRADVSGYNIYQRHGKRSEKCVREKE